MEDQGQAFYDSVVLAAHRNIFGEKDDPTRFQMVVQRLQKGDLAKNAGGIAGATLARIQASAEQQGQPVPQDVLIEAADEIVDQVLNIAEAMKITKDRGAEKKAALMEAMRMVGDAEVKAGKVTPERQAQAKAEMAKYQGQESKVEDTKTGLIAEQMGAE